MFKDFDQSSFNMDLQGFHHNALHITTDYLSDSSQTDTDLGLYLFNAVFSTQSPAYQHPTLKTVNNRVKTPVRINNNISCTTNSHNV